MKIRNVALPMLTSAMLVLFYSLSAALGQGLLGFAILAAGLAGFTVFSAVKTEQTKGAKSAGAVAGQVLRGQSLAVQGSGKQ
ncbi:hypothetical protein C9J01_09470 [Photobacterium rosenbergii]|uniref:Uncharacterized protein n=1 Tax=Photobacterium rosenbergii TaxID=294936 RepID=A0A2T3NHY5_9GAMM|nr:hypothetical protein [Photobacterium rosenbergii]PSW14638.1 hypothetical protein C9J01_09470 [Photobacterium rosenbergii]